MKPFRRPTQPGSTVIHADRHLFDRHSALPLKIPLRSTHTGSLSKRRRSWLQSLSEGIHAQGMATTGWLLLSSRQLRRRLGNTSEGIAMDKAFRIHMHQWPLANDTAELTVTVAQGTTRIAVAVVLPRHCLPTTDSIHHQESTAPLMATDDFIQLWPALLAFAQVHGHARLPRLDLSKPYPSNPLERGQLPFEPTPNPYTITLSHEGLFIVDRARIQVDMDTATLVTVLYTILFTSMLVAVSFLGWLHMIWSALVVCIAIIMATVALRCLWSHIRLHPRTQMVVDHTQLTVRQQWPWGWSTRVELPVWRLKQFFLTVDTRMQFRSTEPGRHWLSATPAIGHLRVLLDDETCVALLPLFDDPEHGLYLESLLEKYLGITDQPVSGEWSPQHKRWAGMGTVHIGCRM